MKCASFLTSICSHSPHSFLPSWRLYEKSCFKTRGFSSTTQLIIYQWWKILEGLLLSVIFKTFFCFLGILFESASQPPHLPGLCLGIGDGQHHWNAIIPRLCVGGWSRSRTLLGRISLSGSSAPQLTLWLLLEGLQLLMVTSYSFINDLLVHTDCLESARHLTKDFTCNASFSPPLTVSCTFLCSLGYRLHQLLLVDGQDCPTSAQGGHLCPVFKCLQDIPLKIMAFIIVPTGSPNLM